MPIDHRRRLNVISTSVTYSPAARVPTFFSFTLLVINLPDSISRSFIFEISIGKYEKKASNFAILAFSTVFHFSKSMIFFKNLEMNSSNVWTLSSDDTKGTCQKQFVYWVDTYPGLYVTLHSSPARLDSPCADSPDRDSGFTWSPHCPL